MLTTAIALAALAQYVAAQQRELRPCARQY